VRYKFVALALAAFLCAAVLSRLHGQPQPLRSADNENPIDSQQPADNQQLSDSDLASDSPQASDGRQQKIDALDDAFRHGLMTRAEYDAKMKQLNAAAALQDAFNNGLLTREEYEAKVRALTAGANAGSNAFFNSEMRTVEIFDPGLQMRAGTQQVPADWKFAGIIDRTGGCHSNGAQVKVNMQSPDGLTGMQVYPGYVWSEATTPWAARNMAQRGCPSVSMTTATELLSQVVLPMLRPHATLDRIDPPKAEGQEDINRNLQQMQANAEREAMQFRGLYARPAYHMLSGAVAHIHFSVDGHEVEESIGTRVHCVGRYFRNGLVTHNCNSNLLYILRAPRGTLEELSPRMMALSRTYRMDQAWDYRMAMIAKQQSDAAIAASNAQFQASQDGAKAFGDALTANWKAGEANRKASVEGSIAAAQAGQIAQDISAHKTVLFALDQRAYVDRQTGTEYDLSNKFNNAYLSSDGTTVVQSPGPVNLNGVTPGISYSELEPH
jgi:Short C-terminal domain